MTMRALRIVKLCAQHNPLDGRVFHLEAKALRDAGHQVTIIAPNPGDMPEQYEVEGIRIRTYQKRWTGIPRKAWTLYTLCKLATEEKADVYHAHEVDAALFAGAVAKKRNLRAGRNCKLVFDAHEVWSYFYAASTNLSFLRRLAVHGILEYEHWMLTRHVDLVIAAHVMETNYYHWQNPFISSRHVLSAMEVPENPPARDGDIRVIGHEGFFTLNRGMDVILEAFELLSKEFPEITLQTAGDFWGEKDRSWFNQWAKRTGLGNRVVLSGWVNRPDLPGFLEKMDIGVAVQREDEHTSRTWPLNKLQNYASHAIPFVMCASMPYAKQKVEERNMGHVVPFDSQKLYFALRTMIENPAQTRLMGHNAWDHARVNWNWERYRKELLNGYEDLMEPTYRPKKTVTLQG
jgi:glycosyltransferase involved in cell wall biosynthesis